MTTTDNPATRLPFLLPAANLVVGDTARLCDVHSGVIRSITRCVPDVLTFAFVGDPQTCSCKPGTLVERIYHAPVEVLNDVVTELTELFEQWNQTADKLLDASDPESSPLLAADMLAESRTRRECSAGIHAILARLQPAQPVSFDTYCAWCQKDWTEHVGGKPGVPGGPSTCPPTCGEYGPNNGVCGELVPDGFCSEHGEVGPPVES
jgi:hypothetical protein